MSVNVTRVVKFRRKPVVLRGPQAWSDCAVGYPFECGAEGEEWKDVVIYGDNWYSCVKSHAKTPTNYPGSSEAEANGYWRLADKIEMVATKILLAQYALVKNLGVECVDMKNQFGVSVFRAKDGEVICRKGTFYNAVIRGLTVSALTNEICTSNLSNQQNPNAPLGGDVCLQASALRLEELPPGTAQSLKILNEYTGTSAPGNLVLQSATENVFISKSGNTLINSVSGKITLSRCGFNSGKFIELFGVRPPDSSKTTWYISERQLGITEQ